MDLRRFAEMYTTAWCSQDAARVASFYSPDGSLQVNQGAPAVGRRAITEVAQSFMQAFPDLLVVMDDLIVLPDGVKYCWTLTGTTEGLGGAGRFVRISGFERWQMSAAGLIACSEGHFDEEEYRRQLNAGDESGGRTAS